MGDFEGFICKNCGMRAIPLIESDGICCTICGYFEEYDTDILKIVCKWGELEDKKCHRASIGDCLQCDYSKVIER